MDERLFAPATYGKVLAALIGLTLLTLGLSFVDLGPWQAVAGLAIAIAKVSLVALFFMHLLHASRTVWLAAGAGSFWLGILLVLTLSDYLARAWQAY